MIILGSGLAGLLCGAINPNSVIYEASDRQPDNHKAVFRLKNPEISKLTGIPMRKVKVHKGIWSQGKNCHITIGLAHQYSKKVTGKISARSIFNLESEYRYIPPTNFSAQLRQRAPNIKYGKSAIKITKDHITFDDQKVMIRTGIPVVSTIPMPAMSNLLGKSDPAPFNVEEVYITQYTISDCDSFCTMYYPDSNTAVYRATINANVLIIESTHEIAHVEELDIFKSLGIEGAKLDPILINHKQYNGKIVDIDHKARQRFIYESTVNDNIYALGRFATWRPKVMLDDVLDDIFHINNLINKGNYAALNHEQEN